MKNIIMPPANWSTMANHFSATLLGVTASLGAILVGVLPATADSLKPAIQSVTLPDGVYLYGESQKPDELGKGYFVFEASKGQVVGALYYPRSSFDCAAGTFKQDELALTVTNSYDRSTNPFEIALDRTSTVASNREPVLGVGLEGFHRLNDVTANDLRMLNVCKADLQGQVNATR